MARIFERVREVHNGKPTSAYRIECNICGKVGTVLPHNGSHSLPHNVVDKKLHQKGWHIGSKPKQDACPDCNRKNLRVLAASAQLLPKEVTAPFVAGRKRGFHTYDPDIKIVTINLPQAPTTDVPEIDTNPEEPAVNAEAPREPTKAEKQIIIAKLMEVHVSEAVGYANGWSDKKVAEDLGTPHAWVAKIREDNFGPENSNEESREVVERMDALQKEIEQIASDFESTIAGLVKRLETLKTEGRSLGKAVSHIQKQFR